VLFHSLLTVPKRISGTAYDRAKARISDHLDRERGKPLNLRKKASDLAFRLGITRGTLSGMLSDEQKAPERGLLHHLDKIADFLDITPSDLVRRQDTPLVELSALEWRIIQHVRQFPPSVREQIVLFYDYFGGLLPEEREQNQWWVKLRRLSAERRQAVERTLDEQFAAQMRSQLGRGTGPAAPASRSRKPPSSAPAAGTRRKNE
jgi:transcriptional regulator with XRE-family HTH domain